MPGAGKQSPEVQAHIRELLEAGFDPTTIHRRLKVGRSSIYRMKRSLQQHGTAYMPSELNRKNGRPKALTPEQELEVRNWLASPENRNRYLDDLVWLIHNRFGVVCSTTTMSKLKRKWLAVIESEETGKPLEDRTRASLLETHPSLPVLQQSQHQAFDSHDEQTGNDRAVDGDEYPHSPPYHVPTHHPSSQDASTAAAAAAALSIQQQAHLRNPDAQIDARLTDVSDQLEPGLDSQLQEQLRREIGREETQTEDFAHAAPGSLEA